MADASEENKREVGKRCSDVVATAEQGPSCGRCGECSGVKSYTLCEAKEPEPVAKRPITKAGKGKSVDAPARATVLPCGKCWGVMPAEVSRSSP